MSASLKNSLIVFLLLLGLSPLAICNEEAGQTFINTQDSRENRKLILKSKRIIFLGDSITYNGGYVTNFETWLKALYAKRNFDVINLGLPSETASGLSEEGHANGKFARPHVLTRIDSILEKTKPDLIFASYGMNCGIYQPFDKDRFAAYKSGISMLKQKADAVGASIIFLTPASFDAKQKPELSHYKEVLENYSKWLVTMRQHGWFVIDVHSHMRKELSKGQARTSNFTYQQDGVHPNAAGHWVMAQPLFRWFGDAPSAESASVTEMINLHHLPAGIQPLIEKRMRLKRDAWLSFTGHKRPNLPKGMELTELSLTERKITKEIKRLVKLSGQ